ncbi:hypothetical protein [Agreia sp. COWG]|uniref:hypothetical protein n=1 Tax=Agreia sp. COWG TaxID=2773266 RepID=UPI001926C67D|nr:hypothetical protein [Agreia sp. COWG]CAD5995470.1 conserved membrane protein of unknown function [Agreia sp. COWG]
MIIRRAFYLALFPAAVVLPVWMLVGSALFDGGGWQTLGVLLGAIVLFVAMSVISGIMFARSSVRAAKAVSWLDVTIQAALYAAVVALGFNTSATPGILAALIVVAVAGFWVSVWQLFSETRRRMQEVFSAFETAQTPPSAGFASGRAPLGARNDGEYIVIETARDDR